MKKLNLLLLALCLIAISAVAQAKNGLYIVRPSFSENVSPAPTRSSQLLYYGGPVISHVKTTVVQWGPNTNSEMKAKAPDFYKNLTGSTHMDMLEQYNTFGKAINGKPGTQQYIGRGTFVTSVTIIPVNNKKDITDEEIQAEMLRQIQGGALPKPDEDTLYMIYFPPGMSMTIAGATSCKSFCAYHSYYGTPTTPHFYYGVMPDIGGFCSFSCGGSSFNTRTSISAHEFTEAITDPYPTPGTHPAYPQAWNNTGGDEIGDLCQSARNNLVTPNTTYVVQGEWDNSKNACSDSTWTSGGL